MTRFFSKVYQEWPKNCFLSERIFNTAKEDGNDWLLIEQLWKNDLIASKDHLFLLEKCQMSKFDRIIVLQKVHHICVHFIFIPAHKWMDCGPVLNHFSLHWHFIVKLGSWSISNLNLQYQISEKDQNWHYNPTPTTHQTPNNFLTSI